MSTWNKLCLQNANSPLMEQLIFFYDHTMIILIMIMIFVGYFLFKLFLNKIINNFFLSNQMIEIIWTLFPMIMLMFVAFPSLRLLYLLDENFNSNISIKSIGHQWFWTYEISNFKELEIDSFLIQKNNFKFRLLETDNNLILPNKFQIRMLINSTDVIHSWTIPSLGIKVDAVPGRMNQTFFFLNQIGLFFGQCSEICGINHSFMPITLESIKMKNFINWMNKN